ncbi:MAG TPA: class II aldolase/adducin family protein, partial [Armatimonadota bacterium]|nr:class II aldolase/adducin family protein [Armatimonadota bacterium]
MTDEADRSGFQHGIGGLYRRDESAGLYESNCSSRYCHGISPSENVCSAYLLKGWVASNDGNISMRMGENYVITTPTGVSKGFMSPDMLVKVDMDGNVRGGYLKPSSEIKIHLEAYRRRNDVRAVLHAHPPVSTG